MRESKFIAQNKDKWRKFEYNTKSRNADATELEEAFVEINDDLAYARTFYKNRAVRLFLNNLLTPIYHRIYKGKSWSLRNTKQFFLVDAPRMNYSARKFMLVSFITVILGFCLGYFATRHNKDFATVILGNNYVAETEANIEALDPLAIYKKTDPGEMFLSIAINNLRVAAYFFLLGALFCVGALYLLLSNGIILGAFTWLFTSRGLTMDYFFTVYQHGTLEILTMVVEGAAGLMLGSGILFPGTLSRMRSMQNAARKSVVMFLVCIPIIVLAAFIESYLTRFTSIPNTLRSIVIIISLLFMLFYFIIYPYLRFRNNTATDGHYDSMPAENKLSPMPGQIYSNNTIVLFGFDYLRKNFRAIFLTALTSLLVFYNLAEWLGDGAIMRDVHFRYLKANQIYNWDNTTDVAEQAIEQLRLFTFNIYSSSYFFSPKMGIWTSLFSGLTFAIIIGLVLRYNKNLMQANGTAKITNIKIALAAIIAALLQTLCNHLFGQAWWLSLVLLFPIQVAFAVFYCMQNSFNPVILVFNGMGMVSKSLGRVLGVALIQSILYAILMFGFLYFVAVVFAITNQFHGGNTMTEGVLRFYVYFNYFMLPIIIALCTYIAAVMAISVHEIQTGSYAKMAIDNLAFRKEVYGVQTE